MTRDQQKRLNAMCGDLEKQVLLSEEDGYIHYMTPRHANSRVMRLDKDSWRWLFCGTYKGWKTVPAIEGAGFVMLGASSRDLTVEEAGDVMTMIEAFGAERGVQFTDPEESALMNAYELESGRGGRSLKEPTAEERLRWQQIRDMRAQPKPEAPRPADQAGGAGWTLAGNR